MNKQKFHVENCLKDPIVDGKYYMELEDGHFVLFRGTNRNESFHKRLNHFWPEKCGPELAECLMKGEYNFAILINNSLIFV